MTGKYQAYPEYKNSNVEWLDGVPSRWKISRLKYLCKIKTGEKDTVDRDDNGRYPFFVRSKKIERISSYSFEGEAILTAGDGDIGKIFHYYDGRFDYHQRVYKFSNFNEVDGRFLYHYLSVNLQKEVIKLSAKTTVDSLRLPMLENFVVVYPELNDQINITKFLDFEVSKIDSLIENQTSLVCLLKENRKATINKAITQGLTSSAPIRNSEIDWLGDIPVHWKITKAKYLFEEQKRPVREGDGIVTSFRDGQVCLRSRRRSGGYTMAILEHGYQSIRKGDLVIHSMDAFAGAIGVSEDDGRATPEYVVTTPYEPQMNCEYYADILRLMAERDYIFVLCPSVRERAPRFRFSKFQQVLLPVPPIEEQNAIKNYLNGMEAKYYALIEKAEEQIKLLEERRTTLITSAVTGKIDVRSWQPPKSSAQEAINA
jgi:type I restriction enzyme S subunit